MPVERNSDKAANLQAHQPAGQPSGQLVDPFGRSVDYIRLSVTDRCDFRCVYCMAEQMTFLPKRIC